MLTAVLDVRQVERVHGWLATDVADAVAIQRGTLEWAWAGVYQRCVSARVALVLMLECGLRVGEVRAVRWLDLHLYNGRPPFVTVTRALGKGGQARRVPTNDLCRRVLGGVWDGWRGRGAHDSVELPADRAVPIVGVTTRSIQRWCWRIGRELLGVPFHPHILRHTYATRVLRVSDLRTVQELLGHQRVATTERYTHVTSAQLAEAVERI